MVETLARTSEAADLDFSALQARLREQFRGLLADDKAPRTIIIVPSLTLDAEILAKVEGAIHYEQRLLCLLALLRFPRARVVYLTSEPIPESIVDYYLHLLPGVPHDHARRRLTLLSAYDSSPGSLTDKILARARLIQRIKAQIVDPSVAHITCFNVTERECALARKLDLPIYGCDPALARLGTKSGARTIFKQAGVLLPDGEEDLRDTADVVEALVALKRRDPDLEKAVVKLNDGFSGEGNAIFSYDDAPQSGVTQEWVKSRLQHMNFVAAGTEWPQFEEKLSEMSGIVEAFVPGETKRLPSVQYRIDPVGTLDTISTHDQVMGGDAKQVFEGCRFPADGAYCAAIQEAGRPVAERLREEGVLGRFAIDFISVRKNDLWRHYALEINLRKGGTTHPFLMLQQLTDGRYDPESGVYRSRSGQVLYYRASDNVQSDHYRGLAPEDLVEIAVENGIHFNAITQEGTAFHMLGALSGHGKLGISCVAHSAQAADELYGETLAALDSAASGSEPGASSE